MKLNNFEKQILEEIKNLFNETGRCVGYFALKKKLELKKIIFHEKTLQDTLTKLCNAEYIKLKSDSTNFGFEIKKWN